MSHTPDPSTLPQAFTGTQRFAVIDQLGAGSMCVVYRAQDRKHGDIVALKTLRHLDSNSLYRLKQEFRALSHFDHPNLVSFSELVYSEQGWFVTMELVEGTDFLTFCRGDEPERESRTDSRTWNQGDDPGFAFVEDEDEVETERVAEKRPLPDMVRLRSCMRQLAEGVQTLHAAGRVHRDLKPSNVLVTEAGRVVILDFGLVAEIDQDYTEGTLHQNIAGSAAYMSPEQSVGKPLAESSDWYSVGVMLYEALTGVWPYTGHLYQILTLKQEEDPAPPSSLVDGVPPELEALCMGLLHRDPEQRPTGSEVLAVFRATRPTTPARTAVRPRFRFRNPQLHEMLQAVQAVKRGRAGLLLVRGPHGVGKTTLIREFVKGVKRRDEVTILKSRCFEWETVPYKALDGLMDNLSRVLRRLDHRDVAKLGNPGLPYLGTLFPVLDRVDAFGMTEPADLRRLDGPAIQQRAFEGLFHLLREMARTAPLLMFFDDVQWGDPDSAGVLAEIVRYSVDLPILVVLSYRTDEQLPFVQRFVSPVQEAGVTIHSLDLEPMTREQACVIAGEMLQLEPHDERVVRIAVESGGVPSFIQELVRQLEFQDSRAALSDDALNAVTVSAIQALPDNARRLLYVLALCDQPLPDDVGLYAADLTGDAFEAVSTLRAHRLVNVTGAKGGDTLEIASEAVRDYVLDRIPEEWRVAFHGRIAASLEERGGARPMTLVQHHVGANQPEKAGLVAWLAADEALKRGARRDAIGLLLRARELGSWTPRERRTISSRLADAFAAVGAGQQAAAAYRDAADESTDNRSRELLHRAAEALITSGQVAEGMTELEQLMVEAGVKVSSGGGWFGGGLRRIRKMRLRWRGMDFTSKVETEVSLDDLHRVDLAWTRASTLGLLDLRKARSAQVTHLELALEVGEPERALRALAAEIRFQAWSREDDWAERYEHLLKQAKARGSRQVLARATAASAAANLMHGRWETATQHALSADQIFSHNQVGSAWERFECRLIAAMARLNRGDLKGSAEIVYPLVPELEAANNTLFLALLLGGVDHWLAMASGRTDDAQKRLGRAASSLATEVGIPFYRVFVAWSLLELHKGDAAAAWAYQQARWDAASAGLAAAPPDLVAEVWLARARVAVANDRPAEARTAVGCAREVGLSWVEPWCLLVEVGLGGPAQAAIPAFASSEQQLGEGLARLAAGQDVRGWFAERRIQSPERLVAVVTGS